MIIMIFIFEREKEIKCIYLTQHYGYYSGIDIWFPVDTTLDILREVAWRWIDNWRESKEPYEKA